MSWEFDIFLAFLCMLSNVRHAQLMQGRLDADEWSEMNKTCSIWRGYQASDWSIDGLMTEDDHSG